VLPVQRAFEQASVVVAPSVGEGFGMAALEAMERGRPVIATGVGGLVDLVRDGETGLFVPPADVDALAEAIVALASDPARARRLGENGRRRALAWFRDTRSVDRLELLYRSLLDAAQR
jgi:glycosyltransferase involved in cell wall biosynthesis